MIIVNKPANDTVKYVIYLGDARFCAYAKNDAEAAEAVAGYLIAIGKSDWYYDAIAVECMAKSINKNVDEFINDTDLRCCPKYNVYLPKCKIKEEN